MPEPKKLEIIFADLNGDSFTNEIYQYDGNGNTIEHIEYETKGVMLNKIVSKYDGGNRVTEERIFADGEIMSEHKKHIRKEDGKLERIEIDYQDGSTSIQYKKKDEENNTEEWIEEDEDGELESREVVEYDEKGKILQREVFDYRGKLKEVFVFEYDDNGDLETRKQLDNKKKLVLTTEYEYDDNKNMVYRANRNRKGLLSDFVKIDYDTAGQVVKQNISGKYSFVFEYDQEGRTVLEERYLPGNQLEYQSLYEYDEEGRMTKEVNLEFTKTYNYEFFD